MVHSRIATEFVWLDNDIRNLLLDRTIKNTLWITGPPGIGKSRRIKEIITEFSMSEKSLWVSDSTRAALHVLLEKYKDGCVIVFDDAEDMLSKGGDDQKTFLKELFDTQPVRRVRRLNMNTLKQGNAVIEVTSKIIVVSQVGPEMLWSQSKRSRQVTAGIKDRVWHFPFNSHIQEGFRYIEHLVMDKNLFDNVPKGPYTLEECNDVLRYYFLTNPRKPPTIRRLIDALNTRKLNPDNWKKLLEIYWSDIPKVLPRDEYRCKHPPEIKPKEVVVPKPSVHDVPETRPSSSVYTKPITPGEKFLDDIEIPDEYRKKPKK